MNRHSRITSIVALVACLAGIPLAWLPGTLTHWSRVVVFGLFFAFELAAFVLGVIGWRSAFGKTAVVLSALLLATGIVSLRDFGGWPSIERINQEPGASVDEQQAHGNPGASSSPAITRVVVSSDQAIIRGRSLEGAGMFIMIGTQTNVWMAGHRGSPFTVTLERPWFARGIHWVIKRSFGPVTYRVESETGSMTGRIVFRPGTPALETDGSYVIGEFKSVTGPTLPITVRLERLATSSAETPTPPENVSPAADQAKPERR